MATPHRESLSQASSSSLPPTSPTTSRSSLSETRSPPGHSPSLRLVNMPNASAQHRQSFSELRGHPPSPRSQRNSSISQIAVQELIDNPPRRAPEPKFAGRDWRTVEVKELTSPTDLKFVDADTGVEDATKLLIDSGAPVLLIREHANSQRVIGTFDYTDLNAYLLMVVGLARPDEEHIQDFQELARKAEEGKPITLQDVKNLDRKELLTFIPSSSHLIRTVETFGHGMHRILLVDEGTDNVTGVLSQSRLVRFLWENGKAFATIDALYPQYLRDLKLGSHEVFSINGDRPLSEALTLLLNEGVSSLPVLDNGHNVVGNISTVDVKLLTKSSSLPLLRNTCIHFISHILSTRGMNEGKDSFPVFYVTPMSTLAYTVAKLVATKSHRMWITEPVSPLSSGPPTPSLHPATLVPTSSHSNSVSAADGQNLFVPPSTTSTEHHRRSDSVTHTPFMTPTGPSISAGSLPGAKISGRLVGVVSLTDVLILFAKASGLSVLNPNDIRKGRRRSSSSSIHRPSIEMTRPSAELSRNGSLHG